MAQYERGDQVVDRRSGEVGVVLKVEPAGVAVMYRVQLAETSRYISEEHLEPASLDPVDRLRDGALGHPREFHLRLQALLLEHAYRHDAYSGLTNARIEPKPHQVSVAARVLEKVRPRMLLADEVGLGKTIETALVLKELFSRRIAQRILIICPASLLTQWENELRSKFNEEFTVVDSITLKYLEKQGFEMWAVERPFELHLPNAVIIGRADVILDEEGGRPQSLAIVDYKTAAEGEHAHDLQLQVYANAGRREGLDVRGAYVHDLKRADREAVDVSAHAVAASEDTVIALVDRLRGKDFSARPGQHRCGRCDVRPLCRFAAMDPSNARDARGPRGGRAASA